MSILTLTSREPIADSMINMLVEAFDDITVPQSITSEIVSGNLTTESQHLAVNIDETLQPILKDLVETLSDGGGLTTEEVTLAAEAGLVGSLLAADPKSLLSQTLQPRQSTEELHVVLLDDNNPITSRKLHKECFNHVVGDNLQEHSCVFNAGAATGDAVTRLIAPTVLFSPSESGLLCTVEILYIQDDALHDVSGNIIDFKRKSLVHALADPTILGSFSRKAVPIVRTGTNASTDKFVPTAEIAYRQIELDGEAHTTGVLKTGVEVDFIGITQTNAMVAKGAAGVSEALNPVGSVEALYVKLDTAKWLRIPTSIYSSASFRKAPTGMQSAMVMSLDTTVLLQGTTKLTNGTELKASIPELDEANNANGDLYKVYMRIGATGDADINSGTVSVIGTRWKVVSIIDNNGDPIDLAAGEGAAIVTALEGNDTTQTKCRVQGYDGDFTLANLNHKRRNKLISSIQYREDMYVSFLEPISCPREVGAVRSPSEAKTLIKIIRVLQNNAAIKFLLESSERIDTWTETAMPDQLPDSLGLMRYLVTPTNVTGTVDVADVVIGLSSAERFADISAVFVNAVRNAIYNMWSESDMAGVWTTMGKDGEKPRIGIVADQLLVQYLVTLGDDRLLGDMFDVVVVGTPNVTMKGKIKAFLSRPITNNKCDCTNLGHMALAPEAVMNLDLPVNGGVENVLSVYPRFRFILTNPVMASLEFENADAAYYPTGG